MKTLVTDPFEDDAVTMLEWLYGGAARRAFEAGRLYGNERVGQRFMNVLSQFDMREYERLTGTLVDPFYDDTKIPAALDLLTTKGPNAQHFAYHTKNNTFTHRTACGCGKGENHWLLDGE